MSPVRPKPDTESAPPVRRRQDERSATMRLHLMEATVGCLIDLGYARTTTVEICRRAGVTRGALLHHFDNLSDLFAATLSRIYDGLHADADARHEEIGGKAMVDRLWAHFSRPEYKAVIELWLACRNEPDLEVTLRPAIARIRDLADPRTNPRLAARLGQSAEAAALYRLVLEAMIGMALGRAVTPGLGILGHEDSVVALLGQLAADQLDEPK